MKTRVYAASFLVVGGLAAFGFACGNKPPPKEPAVVETISDAGPDAPVEAEAPKPKSLYERLGMQAGITKIVDDFTAALQKDAKFSKRMSSLKGPKLEKFKKDLADVICVESGGADAPTGDSAGGDGGAAPAGGPCKYEGRFMKEILGAKSKLKEEEWQAMLIDLRNALDADSVKNDEQQDLAAALGKFRDDVVEPPKKTGKKP